MDRAEIERSLRGAWRLFLGKPDAMRFFDASVDGFWRSFRAIILVAPLYALTALADRHDLLTDANPIDDFGNGPFWAAKALTLALDWVTLPILLGLHRRFHRHQARLSGLHRGAQLGDGADDRSVRPDRADRHQRHRHRQ